VEIPLAVSWSQEGWAGERRRVSREVSTPERTAIPMVPHPVPDQHDDGSVEWNGNGNVDGGVHAERFHCERLARLGKSVDAPSTASV
jgi:hypothetical protein